MSNLKAEQQEIKDLVQKVANGDCLAFTKLEGLARPLMFHLSQHYSSLHHKFEFEDFYSICMKALYDACLEYDPRNPSFFSYAKTFMLNQCGRELEYWNADMRNIFEQDEISSDMKKPDLDSDMEFSLQLSTLVQVEDVAERNEFRDNIVEIIFNIFNEQKAEVMYLYIIEDMSPKDISISTGLQYQNTYTIIRRGMKKIAREYKLRYP